jgi:hypothetical protein
MLAKSEKAEFTVVIEHFWLRRARKLGSDGHNAGSDIMDRHLKWGCVIPTQIMQLCKSL